jgi:ankyrin repeat protein
MSVPILSQQLDADYSAFVVEPALAVVRSLLLRDRPQNVGEYISQHHSRIYFAIEAAASVSPELAFARCGGAAAATGGSDRLEAFTDCVGASTSTRDALEAAGAATPSHFPAKSSVSPATLTAESPAAAHRTPLSPRPAAAAVKRPALSRSQEDGSLAKKSSALPHVVDESSAAVSSFTPHGASCGTKDPLPSVAGKFDTFVMPCGKMEDFHKGVSSRIGFPHLEFEKTMEAEHCSMAGCDMQFTTRNYGITTTARAEWNVVVRGEAPQTEHMAHGRVTVPVEEKLRRINRQFAKKGLEMRLRWEEVIAVVLYTGPMYMLYNCVLARWSSPATMWDTLRRGNNAFTTTLSVLVSAVQKLSAITVIPDGLKLYRGTGGLGYLPAHFSQPDEFNCRGMTEWGFMSCSADKEVAMGYSGAAEGRPHAMVLEIEFSVVDRGAVVSEFSQYPEEAETLFLPMSYVVPTGEQRVERSATGDITVVPVRVSVNLKAERLEQLEEKKKSIHLTGFEFRVNEIRQRLQRLADEGGAEARLKKDKTRQGLFWEKNHTVDGFLQAQVDKVQAVLLRHRARAAVDYSDDNIYRNLVSESLETVRMAESALLWWLRDEGQDIHIIEDRSLLECQRHYESFLKLRCKCVDHSAAMLELCRSRNLLRVDASERDESGETPLIALAARGGNADDVRLLVAAGAVVGAVDRMGRHAMHWAAQQGHAEVVEALARSGADNNQATSDGRTPLWICSSSGQLQCVEVLLKEGADVNKADNDGATPLFMASQNGYRDIVDALLQNGADVNRVTSEGATPLHAAAQDGHCNVVAALLRGGAQVDRADDDGGTPLFYACQNGHRAVMNELLHGGADANRARKDQFQHRALSVARI